MFNNFVQKGYRLRDKVEKYCGVEQGTDDNTAHAQRTLVT
jgi:hypothetical protein